MVQMLHVLGVKAEDGIKFSQEMLLSDATFKKSEIISS